MNRTFRQVVTFWILAACVLGSSLVGCTGMFAKPTPAWISISTDALPRYGRVKAVYLATTFGPNAVPNDKIAASFKNAIEDDASTLQISKLHRPSALQGINPPPNGYPDTIPDDVFKAAVAAKIEWVITSTIHGYVLEDKFASGAVTATIRFFDANHPEFHWSLTRTWKARDNTPLADALTFAMVDDFSELHEVIQGHKKSIWTRKTTVVNAQPAIRINSKSTAYSETAFVDVSVSDPRSLKSVTMVNQTSLGSTAVDLPPLAGNPTVFAAPRVAVPLVLGVNNLAVTVEPIVGDPVTKYAQVFRQSGQGSLLYLGVDAVSHFRSEPQWNLVSELRGKLHSSFEMRERDGPEVLAANDATIRNVLQANDAIAGQLRDSDVALILIRARLLADINYAKASRGGMRLGIEVVDSEADSPSTFLTLQQLLPAEPIGRVLYALDLCIDPELRFANSQSYDIDQTLAESRAELIRVLRNSTANTLASLTECSSAGALSDSVMRLTTNADFADPLDIAPFVLAAVPNADFRVALDWFERLNAVRLAGGSKGPDTVQIPRSLSGSPGDFNLDVLWCEPSGITAREEAQKVVDFLPRNAAWSGSWRLRPIVSADDLSGPHGPYEVWVPGSRIHETDGILQQLRSLTGHDFTVKPTPPTPNQGSSAANFFTILICPSVTRETH